MGINLPQNAYFNQIYIYHDEFVDHSWIWDGEKWKDFTSNDYGVIYLKNNSTDTDDVAILLTNYDSSGNTTAAIFADGTISGKTYYGDGSNLTGISGGGFSTSGGTFTGPVIFISGLTANTISATTYLNLPLDIRTTGATYSNGTATFTNNNSTTYTLTGLTLPFTGGTVTGSTNYINGLTANTISATTYLNLPLDIRTTGGTYSNNTFTFTNNTGGTYSVLFNTLTGLTVNGVLSATTISGGTFYGNGSGLTNFTSGQITTALGYTPYNSTNPSGYITGYTDTYTTGGTYSNGIINIKNNLGNSFNIEGLYTGTTDFYVPYSGANNDVHLGTREIYTGKLWLYDEAEGESGSLHYADEALHFENSEGETLIYIEPGFVQLHNGQNIQSNLFTTLLTQIRNHYLPDRDGTIALTANTLSGYGITDAYPLNSNPRGYLTAYTDTYTTGGTYSNGSAVFTNNSGGTFTVNGFTTPFTGGTVAGATQFTNGLTANTISATTYLNLPSSINIGNSDLTLTGNRNLNTQSGYTLTINPATTFTKTVTLNGNISSTAWGVNGINLQTSAATYTDTSSTGTVTNNMVNTFGIPTIATTNTGVTYTNASTLYIAGAPVAANTGITITNPTALSIGSGKFVMNSPTTNATFAASQIVVANSSGSTGGFFMDLTGSFPNAGGRAGFGFTNSTNGNSCPWISTNGGTQSSMYLNGYASVQVYGFTAGFGFIANGQTSSLTTALGRIHSTGIYSLPVAGVGAALYTNTVLTASQNNQTAASIYINDTFSNGSFSGLTQYGIYQNNTAFNYLQGNTGVNTNVDAGYKLDVNGTSRHTGLSTFQGGVLTSGNISSSTFGSVNQGTLQGIGINHIASTYSATNPVTASTNYLAVDVLGGDTITSTSATTYTVAYGLFVKPPVAGTNTTFSNASNVYAIGTSGNISANGINASGNLNASTVIATNYIGTNLSTPNTVWCRPQSNNGGLWLGTSSTNMWVGFGSTNTTGINIDNNANLTAAKIIISANVSASGWTTNGVGLVISSSTYTDTTSTGSVVNNMVNTFGQPTINTSNTGVTYQQVATLYVAGAPIAANTGVTLQNTYSIYANGRVQINGAIGTTLGINSNGNIFTTGGNFIYGNSVYGNGYNFNGNAGSLGLYYGNSTNIFIGTTVAGFNGLNVNTSNNIGIGAVSTNTAKLEVTGGILNIGTYGNINVNAGNSQSMIVFSGSGTIGGTGYTDFIKVVNTSAGATNINKTIRVNNTGGLEFLNSAYNSLILSITDNGILNVGTATSSNSDGTSNYLSLNANNSQIYDDGNLHIHSRASGQSLWINTNGGQLNLLTQIPYNGASLGTGVAIGTGTLTGFVTINTGKTYTTATSYGYLTTSGAGTYPGGSQTLSVSLYATSRIMAQEVDAYSDERMKDIHGEIGLDEAIKLVKEVKPIKFNWKNDESKSVKTGYSAQQTAKSGYDHLITLLPKEGLEERIDDDGFISPKDTQFLMNYDQVIPYHGTVIKYLLEKIESLEKKLNDFTKNK